MSDRTRVSVQVGVPRDVAFEAFTSDIDEWWRRGKRFRMGDESRVALETRLGGRFTETVSGPQGEVVYVMGRVQVWEPPKRLVFSWRAANFESEDPSTEVEVQFERAIGHSGEGTLVVIEHRGFDAVRADHPVRHGQEPRVFIASFGRWWGDLMSRFRELTLTKR